MNLFKENKLKIICGFIFLTFFSLTSCDEEGFLTNEPVDFYSPENSYVTFDDFESAIINLHGTLRDFLWGDRGRRYWYGSDLQLSVYDRGVNYNQEWSPTNISTNYYWDPWWEIIYNANAIIERSQASISELTNDQKTLIQAEARFFRGYSYKVLANLFGGVPIVLKETKTPRKNYVRASRQETYEQSANDLEFAIENLPDIDEANDFRIHKLIASHYLAEVYVSLGKWEDAIDETSKVIDHPATHLMTERFGNKYSPEDVEKFGWFDPTIMNPETYGDVFTDLFTPGNQNRSNGNQETLWVLQYAWQIPGGGGNGLLLERWATPDLTKANITQSDGTLSPVIQYPNTFYNGRGQGFCGPTPYAHTTVWEKSGWDQDIRNAPYNIIRDVKVRNSENEYDGQWVVADNLPLKMESNSDTLRYWFPIFGKNITPGAHPTDLYLEDQTTEGALTGSARKTFREKYMLRLAETYLLRAEAYLGNGNAGKAAADINVVRRRAEAPEVNPSEVNIDYILDERLRELNYEKLRLATLNRLGANVRRLKQNNMYNGRTLDEHNNLMAIPQSEIQKNVEAPLEQNPGY